MGETDKMLPACSRLFYYRAKLLGYMWFDDNLPDMEHPEEAIGLPVPQDNEHQERIRTITELVRAMDEDHLQQLSATLETPHYVQELRQEHEPDLNLDVIEHEAKEQADKVLAALQQFQESEPATDNPATIDSPDARDYL